MNFDAKVRRESFEPVDLFHAHIGGMDAFARGLKIAAAIRKDGRLEEFVKQRYASWDTRHRREDRSRQGRLRGTRSLHAQEGRSGAQRQRSPGNPGKPDQRIHLNLEPGAGVLPAFAFDELQPGAQKAQGVSHARMPRRSATHLRRMVGMITPLKCISLQNPQHPRTSTSPSSMKVSLYVGTLPRTLRR